MKQLRWAAEFVGVVVLLAAAGQSRRDVMVIAHRGASWDAPEHTFAALDLAIDQGAEWIEHDLQLTRDGVLVVMHDDSLERTARGPARYCTGLVRDRSLADLRHCEVGSWFNAEYPDRARAEYVGATIPTLDSVLTRYAGRARFYIEVKEGPDAVQKEMALLTLLRSHRLIGREARAGRIIVQSFDSTILQRLHAREPLLPLVQLLGDDPVPAAQLEATLQGIAKYAKGVGPSRRVMGARFVAAARAAGLVVHPYTVNEVEAMRYMIGLGVDGMFTDRPAELLRITR